VTFFSNGNVLQIYPNNEKRVDFTKDKNLTKTKFKSGVITLKDEHILVKFLPDGSQMIAHSDGTTKFIDINSYMTVISPDGTKQKHPCRVGKATLQFYEKEIAPINKLDN